jgi:phosphatidylserine/phosphatidylglycerophosphate/cardiolipin synthase-like enzyme
VIQNPYITLTKKMRRALIEAATGPNQAEIYLSTSSPGTTDSPLTQAVFSYEWRKIQKEIPGIKIYAYKGANDLHAKIFVFDQQKVLISGYNLDSLSERFNSEFGLLVDSSDFASLVEANILSVINNDSNPYETEPEPSAKYGFFYLLSGLIKSWL